MVFQNETTMDEMRNLWPNHARGKPVHTYDENKPIPPRECSAESEDRVQETGVRKLTVFRVIQA